MHLGCNPCQCRVRNPPRCQSHLARMLCDFLRLLRSRYRESKRDRQPPWLGAAQYYQAKLRQVTFAVNISTGMSGSWLQAFHTARACLSDPHQPHHTHKHYTFPPPGKPGKCLVLKQKTPALFDEVLPLRGREKPTGHTKSNQEGMKEEETDERN